MNLRFLSLQLFVAITASLLLWVLVAAVSAIAGWVATGTERIAYAGLQIAFAFFYAVFQGVENYAPDSDLDNVRNRVVGILLGLFVTAVVFQYSWPEGAIDRLRNALRQPLQQLAQVLMIHDHGTQALIGQISTDLAQARRQAELASFEREESSTADQLAPTTMENIPAQVERIFTSAKLLVNGAERNDKKLSQTRTALLLEIAAERQRLN